MKKEKRGKKEVILDEDEFEGFLEVVKAAVRLLETKHKRRGEALNERGPRDFP